MRPSILLFTKGRDRPGTPNKRDKESPPEKKNKKNRRPSKEGTYTISHESTLESPWETYKSL